MPRRPFNTGKSGSGISSPNSSREIMWTTARVRTVESHQAQLPTSRSNLAGGTRLRWPQILQTNSISVPASPSTGVSESEDFKDGSSISVVDGLQYFL